MHLFFKWPIVSPDKTLIHHLVSFIAIRSCTKTVILTFNRLESIEVHYMDKNPGMFSSKTLIYFRLKKEMHKHLGWHGGQWRFYIELLSGRDPLWARPPIRKKQHNFAQTAMFYYNNIRVRQAYISQLHKFCTKQYKFRT